MFVLSLIISVLLCSGHNSTTINYWNCSAPAAGWFPGAGTQRQGDPMAQGSSSCCQPPSTGTASSGSSAGPSREQQKGAALKDIHLSIPFPPGWIHSTPRKRSLEMLHSTDKHPRTDTARERQHQILTPSNLKGSAQSCSSCQPLSVTAKAPQSLSFTAQEGRHQPLHPKGSFYSPLTLLFQLLTLLRVFKINPVKMRWEEGIYPYTIFSANYICLTSSLLPMKLKKKKK